MTGKTERIIFVVFRCHLVLAVACREVLWGISSAG